MAISPSNPVDRSQILEAATALRMVDCARASPARLIIELCDEQLDADGLANKIEAQPLLSLRVLKVANSAYYGQSRSVGTIKKALFLLGVNNVRAIAAAACIDQVMPKRIACLPDIGLVARHGLATAIACDKLASVAHPLLSGDAFLAGLLHNLGVVLQASVDPPGVACLISAIRDETSTDIRSLERQHCQVGHEECAAVLFDEWQLPDRLVAAALHHHGAAAAPSCERICVSLVAAASDLALMSGHAFCLEPAKSAHDVIGFQAIGVPESTLHALLTDLPQQVSAFGHALG